MNADWEKAIAFVLKMEGDYTVDPNDPGGETNYGISKTAYPSLDIKNLTMEQAKDIYFKDYWQACQCDQIPAALAMCVFDTAVNQGPRIAKRLLQVVLNVTVDGVIGPNTIGAAHKATERTALKYLAERLMEYKKLYDKNPKLLVFEMNWTFRVISLASELFK